MYEKLNIENEYQDKIIINRSYLEEDMTSLNEFASSIPSFNNLSFAKRAMFDQEIKTNNEIEGMNDSLLDIRNVIDKKKVNNKNDIRIYNLYKGYLYILENSNINKDTLKELYSILSKDLLCDYDLEHMGSYYRNDDVFISNGISLSEGDFRGVDYNNISYYMDMYFDFESSNFLEDNKITNFIKSQIMHYYFVLIHPYFDVNGRTSRTLAMWKLLNYNNYPYIIFNRAITEDKGRYSKVIGDCRKYNEVTLFLKYMMDNVRATLEKELVIDSITNNSRSNITKGDQEMINYIFNLNGNITIKDLEEEYNRHNRHKNRTNIYLENIVPLIEKNIILIKDSTKNNNYYFKLNDNLIDVDDRNIKKLKLNRYLNKKK